MAGWKWAGRQMWGEGHPLSVHFSALNSCLKWSELFTQPHSLGWTWLEPCEPLESLTEICGVWNACDPASEYQTHAAKITHCPLWNSLFSPFFVFKGCNPTQAFLKLVDLNLAYIFPTDSLSSCDEWSYQHILLWITKQYYSTKESMCQLTLDKCGKFPVQIQAVVSM